MLDWYALRAGGLLIRIGHQRARHDFAAVKVPRGDWELALLKPSAVLLPDRPPAVVEASHARITLDSRERIELIHTSTDLYRTQMGKALFCAEAARRVLGLEHATGVALYRRDNAILRELLTEHPNVRAVQWPDSSADRRPDAYPVRQRQLGRSAVEIVQRLSMSMERRSGTYGGTRRETEAAAGVTGSIERVAAGR